MRLPSPPPRLLGRPSRPHGRLPRTVAGCCGFLWRLPRPTPLGSSSSRLYSDNGIDLHRPSTARHSRTCCTRGAPTCDAAGCFARAVSIAGSSPPSSPRTSSTPSPSAPICASSTPWRVSRRRRSDQPTPRTSTPSTSPSTRLPPIEHRGAAASPLRAAAPPPLIHATGLRRAFRGVYVAGGLPPLHRLAPGSYAGPSGRGVAARGHLRRPPRIDVRGHHSATPSARVASIHAWSSSRRWVFLAYFVYRRRAPTPGRRWARQPLQVALSSPTTATPV